MMFQQVASGPQILYHGHLPREALPDQIRAPPPPGSHGSLCIALSAQPQVPFYTYFHDDVMEFVCPSTHFSGSEPHRGGFGLLDSSLDP